MGLFMSRNGTSRVWFKWSWIIAVSCIVCLFFIFLLMQSSFVKKVMYPIEYEDEVRVSSQAFGVDPYLIMAIIRVESSFDPEVSSHKGAYGLMQLMPDTAKWMVDAGHFEPQFLERLEEPAVNIHMGSWYIGQLLRQFEGNPVAAIAAYNAGPGRVETWLREKEWDGEFRNIEEIPYGETRHYIQRVLYYYDKYKEVHPDMQTNVSPTVKLRPNNDTH